MFSILNKKMFLSLSNNYFGRIILVNWFNVLNKVLALKNFWQILGTGFIL